MKDTPQLAPAWRHNLDKAGWSQVHGDLQLGAGGVGMADVIVKVVDSDGETLGMKTFLSLWEGKRGTG